MRELYQDLFISSYPFDVNEAILWLAELCDMVFVFFDPIGQALCKRTLNIVEKIRKARHHWIQPVIGIKSFFFCQLRLSNKI